MVARPWDFSYFLNLHECSGVRRMRRSYGMAALALALAMTAVLGWIFLPTGEDALVRAREGRTLRVGYALEAPFVILSPQVVANDPELREAGVGGEAPTVLRAVLGRLGFNRVEWLRSDFGSLIHELESGRIDIIAAGMYITLAREVRVLFSRPTAHVRTGMLQLEGMDPPAKNLADLRSYPDRRLGVLAGAVELTLAGEAGLSPERVLAYPDAASALQALQNGRVEAMALSSVSLRYLEWMYPEGHFVLVDEAMPEAAPGRPALVFRKSDRRLRDAVDGVLAEYLGSAEHLAAVAEFGFTAADIPERAP
ncbi:MAG: hypothetical protein CGU28_12010 [Candidatus Dactylopiibacterium carminicum]|nr:MAG: hypothetical protein CGU28_12010 [Candidatus Dactylopiibacterium carminicum]